MPVFKPEHNLALYVVEYPLPTDNFDSINRNAKPNNFIVASLGDEINNDFLFVCTSGT